MVIILGPGRMQGRGSDVQPYEPRVSIRSTAQLLLRRSVQYCLSVCVSALMGSAAGLRSGVGRVRVSCPWRNLWSSLKRGGREEGRSRRGEAHTNIANIGTFDAEIHQIGKTMDSRPPLPGLNYLSHLWSSSDRKPDNATRLLCIQTDLVIIHNLDP